MADCFVTDRDYRLHFVGRGSKKVLSFLGWQGEERRSGTERRSGKHDRRWASDGGRRVRLGDRRHNKPNGAAVKVTAR